MKLRVLGILSLISILVVTGVSYALAASASRELTQELQINRVSALNRFAQVAYDAALDGNSDQLQREMDRYAELYGEGILVHLQERTLRAGGMDETRPEIRDALTKASLNLSDTAIPPLQPFGSGPEVVARSFGSANQVLGEAVLEVNPEAARQKLRERWLAVAVAATALGAVLLLAAARVTQWVLRPVHRLNTAVTELASTGQTGRIPEDGPPELRKLGQSFSAMAKAVTESMESQRRLIADTSHQLRNPVAALRLRIDLLQLELKSPKEQAAAVAVQAELERVEEILDGVLRLAAAEHRAFEDGARAAATPDSLRGGSAVDPFIVLQEEVERARPAAQRAGALLVLEPARAPAAELSCNAAELAQMVGELLNNAIKYAPGATICAAIRILPHTAAVEVNDDGPGLSEAERAASLGRFWRSPQHRHVRGNGLGMTIVDRLAGANGGRLVLAERSPHGLVARLEFPLDAGAVS